MKIKDIDFAKSDGLVPVVFQDTQTMKVRMLGYANAEAVRLTLETKRAHFFSRSRGRLWKKGEISGNIVNVDEVWGDCDGDALLYLGIAVGPTCHTGEESCFFRRLEK